MNRFLLPLLLVGCTSIGGINSRSPEGVSIIREAMLNVLAGDYAVDSRSKMAVAICFPTLVDPPRGFLESLNKPNLFPCSALRDPTSSLPTLAKTGERATQCWIHALRVEPDGLHAVVEGGCADQGLSGSGFVVTLEKRADGWKALKGRSTWIS